MRLIMKIIEVKSTGKENEALCEDGWIVTPCFAAVIDGSTSKTKHQIVPGTANGRTAMILIKSVIATLPKDTTLPLFASRATQAFKDTYASRGIDLNRLSNHPEDRLCASVIVYSAHRREVWMIGDCQCLIHGVYYDNPKKQEVLVAAKRAEVLKDAISKGSTTNQLQADDIGRKAILPLLVRGMREENVSYSVVDGFPIPLEKTKFIKVRKMTDGDNNDTGDNKSKKTAVGHGKEGNEKEEIVLASDGYPFLKPTLAESEAALEKQLHDDPLNIRTFLATKGLLLGYQSFDDRTYLRLSV